MSWQVPMEAMLRDTQLYEGWELVQTWNDPNYDKLHVHVAIDGDVMRRAQFGDHGHARRIVDAVKAGVASATLARHYDLRPRPRLGAGTVGYARRRRP